MSMATARRSLGRGRRWVCFAIACRLDVDLRPQQRCGLVNWMSPRRLMALPGDGVVSRIRHHSSWPLYVHMRQ
jgi:hypothetical protein